MLAVNAGCNFFCLRMIMDSGNFQRHKWLLHCHGSFPTQKKRSNLPIRLPGVTRLIASNDKGMNQALLLTRNV